ncbi:MAG: hypothetical protein QNK37_03580 [Acidobacteriota bacterium]|nr:hypothetical protein [Acidobacteriota bacterium]
MAIYEPAESSYEPEYRLQFLTKSPPYPHVVVQGSVNLGTDLMGNDDETIDNEYDVRLLVGPYWKHLRNVVPSVTINGYWNSNADEDDQQKWDVWGLTWDTVGEFGANNDELRIRLKFNFRVRGEESRVMRIGYYLIANGRGLGAEGLNIPGPVKEQG